jgi:hypothetical protein
VALTRDDIEFSFIRSLACSGFILSGPNLSPDDRRERIRIAIMKSQMSGKPLPIDPNLTYAEAFKLAYNRPCELRTVERDQMANQKMLALEAAFGAKAESSEEEEDESEDAEFGLL